jgi:hypothetical protein
VSYKAKGITKAQRHELMKVQRDLRMAVRDKQIAERETAEVKADYDRRNLVKAMGEGQIITWPEDDPTLGVTSGEAFVKRNGKLVKMRTFAGQPVLDATATYTTPPSGKSLDFTKERHNFRKDA